MEFWNSIKDSFQIAMMSNDIDPDILLWRVLIAMLMGILIAIISFLTYSGKRYDKSVIHSQLMITVVAAIIINVVGASITYGLGLFAALSFIRFRSSIRDPKDTSIFFFSASVGMACGAGYFLLAIFGVVVMTIVQVGLRFLPIFELEYSTLTINYYPPEAEKPSTIPGDVEKVAEALNNITPSNTSDSTDTAQKTMSIDQTEISQSKYSLLIKDILDTYFKVNKVKATLTAISAKKNRVVYQVPLPLEKAFALGENIIDNHPDIINNFKVDLDQ